MVMEHLPADILQTLIDLLNKKDNCGIIHNLRLRSVCNSWRFSVSISPPPPQIVVPFPYFNILESKIRSGVRHFTLSRSTVYLLQHAKPTPSASPSPYWLLMVKKDNIINNKLCVLDPLHSRRYYSKMFPEEINLLDFHISPIKTSHTINFVDDDDDGGKYQNIELDFGDGVDSLPNFKLVVSSPYGGGDSHSFAIMAIYQLRLYFFELGDKKWIEVHGASPRYLDLVFYNGSFYAVDNVGRVVSVGLSDLKVVQIGPRVEFPGDKKLLESNGALYLYARSMYSLNFDKFKIYKLNEKDKEWEIVHDLDNHAFFIGDDCSYSISARDFPGLQTNCVYFLHNEFKKANRTEKNLEEFCSDIGVYSLDDGSCGPLVNFPDHWSLFLASPTRLNPKGLNPRRNEGSCSFA